MKLYVKVYFGPSNPKPLEVAEEMKDMGFKPVMGEYDFAQEFDSPSEYEEMVDQLRRTLRGRSLEGSDLYFRLNTKGSERY
ncbi:MAG: hypothetical protein KGY76_02455 [Candidatus Thermoplasmatota archaeon]|nr:hypothetical protein [Candidatus Thermoplasmatota archaeon]